MADLDHLSDFADGLLANLTPVARRKLATDIARGLRESQQRRIQAQQNPDGSGFTPRRPQKSGGKIRSKAMFGKIRQAKWLKTRSTPATAEVEFLGRVQRIAQVHQFGLRDRVRKGGFEVDYARRELLGLSDADINMIGQQIINQLSD